MNEINQIKRDRVAAVLCQQSLLFFTKYFFKETNRRQFIVNDHHLKIIDALERVMRGELTRLIITVPPRYGKTELAVKMFIAHCLALNATAKFIHLSYSDSLALDNSEEIKDLICTDEYQKFFGHVEIKKDSKAKNKWYTTEGGGVLARSSAGQVTGFGAGKVEDTDYDEFITDLEKKKEFGGAIIIDDPIKPEDADSATIREKINQRFDSTIRSRVNSRNTPIIVIMQRLHPHDLAGYLIEEEPDTWETISLPAIDEEGNALWPYKHTIEELRRMEEVNPLVFRRQYLQDPQPQEGLLFPKDELNFYSGETFDTKSAEITAISSFIDTADEGNDNLCNPYGFNIGSRVYVHDVVFTKEGVQISVPLVADKLNKYRPEYCRVESNMGGSMYIGLLQGKVSDAVVLLSIRAKANKHTRILTLSGFIKEHFYFRDDYEPGSDYDLFMRNIMQYIKNGKVDHDDGPDAITGLAAMIKTFYPDLYAAEYREIDDGYTK